MGSDRKIVRLFPLLSSNLEVNVSGAHYPSPAHVAKLMSSCASHVYGSLVYILMPPPPPLRPPPSEEEEGEEEARRGPRGATNVKKVRK